MSTPVAWVNINQPKEPPSGTTYFVRSKKATALHHKTQTQAATKLPSFSERSSLT